jgi:hypothetical protein
MPEQFYTPFNGAGGQTRVTDMDRISLQQQNMQTARDAAMMEIKARMQMQQAELGDRAQGRSMEYGDRGAARSFQGGMADKSMALQRDMDTSATDRAFGMADRQMAPALMGAQLDRAKFDEGAGVRGAEQGLLMQALQQAGGGISGGGGSSMNPLDVIAAMKGGDVSGNQIKRDMASLQMEELKRGMTKTRQQELLAADPAAARQAATESGVPLSIAPIEEYMSQNPGLTSGLSNKASSFAAQDADTFGWDPTEQDVTDVIGERDRVVQLLTQKGYAPEAALREANRLITSSKDFSQNQNDVNAGWTQNLRQRGGF